MSGESQMTRALKLAADKGAQVGAVLQGVEGVESVEPCGPQTVKITYDIRRIGWGEIGGHLRAAGLYSPGGLFARWRDEWRNFQDQNMRDNLQHQPHCCSKPPAGAGRK